MYYVFTLCTYIVTGFPDSVSVYLLTEKDTMDVWCNGQNIETAVSDHS